MSDPAANVTAIAASLQADGFLVTVAHEVESAGAAMMLGLTPKTLRNWRSDLTGPPWRIVRGLAWYRIQDVLAWGGGTLVSLQPSGSRADAPPS